MQPAPLPEGLMVKGARGGGLLRGRWGGGVSGGVRGELCMWGRWGIGRRRMGCDV